MRKIVSFNLNKKLFTILLAIFLCFSTNVVFGSSSATFSEKTEYMSDTILVALYAGEKSNISGLSISVQYDASEIEVSEASVGKTFAGGMSRINPNESGKVLFSFVSTNPVIEDGEVFYIKCKSLTTDNETIKLECNITECIDTNCDNINTQLNSVEILNPRYSANENKIETISEEASAIIADSGKDSYSNASINEKGELVLEPVENLEESNGPVGETNSNTDSDGNQDETNSNQTSENRKSNLIWIIPLVIVCVGIIVFIYIKKRRKRG